MPVKQLLPEILVLLQWLMSLTHPSCHKNYNPTSMVGEELEMLQVEMKSVIQYYKARTSVIHNTMDSTGDRRATFCNTTVVTQRN